MLRYYKNVDIAKKKSDFYLQVEFSSQQKKITSKATTRKNQWIKN